MSYSAEDLAVDLLRALRGRRSCAEFSRRAGYRSNIAARWESRAAWPTAARYLQMHARMRRSGTSWLERFFGGPPPSALQLDPRSSEAVAAFLRHLKGKTPLLRIAELAEHNRYGVSRWFSGQAEPKLPEFLRLVELTGRRLLDLVAALEDPATLPSTRDAWARLSLAREAAYNVPWSHAVLRALEIEGCPRSRRRQLHWVAQRLAISESVAAEAIALLESTGQVVRTKRGLSPREVTAVHTSPDPERERALKLTWARTALARLEGGAPGWFGFSLFAISAVDLKRLQDLQLDYIRAMQAIIADSMPSECVGLYCVQLLDLAVPSPASSPTRTRNSVARLAR